MAQNIAVLGSTGSIGVQTLDVARNLGIKVSALTAYSNIDLLELQAREFSPRLVAAGDAALAAELRKDWPAWKSRSLAELTGSALRQASMASTQWLSP